MAERPNHAEVVTALVASGLGLFTAAVDKAAPFGDDSSMLTVLLWLLFSGVMGFSVPRRPWRWALVLGPWTALLHLVVHALGLADSIHPNTYATILILVPVSLAACCLGAYGGAMARRLVVRPGLT
jgi:hypothetical protein